MLEGRKEPGGPFPRDLERGGLGPSPELKRRQEVVEGPPFWSDLPGLFAYPLRGHGVVRNLISAVFFAVLFFFLGRFPGALGPGGLMLGATLGAALAGYILAYLILVTQKTIQKEADPPDWPDFRSFVEMGWTFASVFLLCLVPVGVPVAAGAWIGGRVSGLVGVVAAVLAAVPGLFYVPMSLLLYTVNQNVTDAFNPALVIASIGRCLGPYVVLVLFVYALLLLFFVFAVVISYVPLTGIAFYFLAFYFFLVLFRLFGLFYLQCQVRLAWYAE